MQTEGVSDDQVFTWSESEKAVVKNNRSLLDLTGLEFLA